MERSLSFAPTASTTGTKSLQRSASDIVSNGGNKSQMLKTHFKIGSVHGRVNYNNDDRAFHPNDVPAAAVAAKRYVKERLNPNILRTKKPIWNQSSDFGERPVVRKSRQISAYDRTLYKYNYRAEVLTQSNPDFFPKATHLQFDRMDTIKNPSIRREGRTMRNPSRMSEMPVHPNLEDKKRWSLATRPERNERANMFELHETSRLRASKARKSEPLLNYMTLTDRETMFNDDRRKLKARLGNGSSLVVEAERRWRQSLIEEQKLQQFIQRSKLQTTVSRKYKKYHHNGKFEILARPGEKDRWYWSCCMAEDEAARGCIVVTVNPDAYNFASPDDG